MPSVLLTWNDIKDKLADVCEAGDVDGLKDHYEVLPTNRQPLSIDSKVNAGDENCLHIVVRNGHVTCAEYLLARGAGVNVTGKKGMAAVHLAAIRGDLRMLDMIVEVSAVVGPRVSRPFVTRDTKHVHTLRDITLRDGWLVMNN